MEQNIYILYLTVNNLPLFVFKMSKLDYSQGKIYKIIPTDEQNKRVYIGSTALTLHERLGYHVRSYKSYLRGYGNYTSSFEFLATENYEIQLVEDYPCSSKRELEEREEWWINNTLNCVNIKSNYHVIEGTELERDIRKVHERAKSKISVSKIEKALPDPSKETYLI